MRLARTLGGAILVVAVSFAGSSCGTTVSDTSAGGGGGNGSSKAPKSWCSPICGVVAHADDCGGNTTVCGSGEVCALCEVSGLCTKPSGDVSYICCDPATNPGCAFRLGNYDVPGEKESDKLYCSRGGWLRFGDPKVGPEVPQYPEPVCAPNEICAARKGEYWASCCDPKKDPSCGTVSKECFQTMTKCGNGSQ